MKINNIIAILQTKGSNVQGLAKTLTVINPSEMDKIKNNYKGSNTISADTTSSSALESASSYLPITTSTTTTISDSCISKLKTPLQAVSYRGKKGKEGASETTNASTSNYLKELDVPKSKPFVPARVLMSHNGNHTSQTYLNLHEPIRKETKPVSTVQKLIQTHNQAVAAAAAPASPVTGYKQPLIINNQSSSK